MEFTNEACVRRHRWTVGALTVMSVRNRRLLNDESGAIVVSIVVPRADAYSLCYVMPIARTSPERLGLSTSLAPPRRLQKR
jgi:hypothetical protein